MLPRSIGGGSRRCYGIDSPRLLRSEAQGVHLCIKYETLDSKYSPVTSLTGRGDGGIAGRDQLPRALRKDLGTVCNDSKTLRVN